MLPEERRRRIVHYLNAHGSAPIPDLCEELRVSPATVRRDLAELEHRGLLGRTHGGAVSVRSSTAYEPPYVDKKALQVEEKRAIAAVASERVQNGDVVVLDSGSTTLMLASFLQRKHHLTVVTTDLKIALALSDASGIEVVIVGGRVRPRFYSVVGAVAETSLGRFHANHAFVGADALHPDAGLTNANLDEVAVKRGVLASAARTTVLADHTKFDKTTLAEVAPLHEIDEIITDWRLPTDTVTRYRDAGATVTRAPRRTA